jgi:hypothetical protein
MYVVPSILSYVRLLLPLLYAPPTEPQFERNKNGRRLNCITVRYVGVRVERNNDDICYKHVTRGEQSHGRRPNEVRRSPSDLLFTLQRQRTVHNRIYNNAGLYHIQTWTQQGRSAHSKQTTSNTWTECINLSAKKYTAQTQQLTTQLRRSATCSDSGRLLMHMNTNSSRPYASAGLHV